MKVKDFKALVNGRFKDEDDECDIFVHINNHDFEIAGIADHGNYTRPGGLPFELLTK